jgi:signal peptidase II
MKRLGLLAFVFLVFGLTSCDHTTKHLIHEKLSVGQVRPIITGVLDFRHTLNADSAFSLLGGTVPLNERLLLLRVAAWLAVAIIIGVIAKSWKQARTWERVAWALILSGAFGNALDRLLRGPVVDFIDFHFWPVFNVADIWVTLGIALLLLTRKHSVEPSPRQV